MANDKKEPRWIFRRAKGISMTGAFVGGPGTNTPKSRKMARRVYDGEDMDTVIDEAFKAAIEVAQAAADKED